MTAEEIIEGNNEIAIFVGSRFIKDNFFPNLMNVEFELMDLDDLIFHSSWDWLMPVVEKIEGMGYVVYIWNHDCRIWDKEVLFPYNERPLIDGWYANYMDSTKILTAWNAVVQFIKWYNLKSNP